MSELTQPIKLTQPAEYLIEIQGRLETQWSNSFNGMKMTTRMITSGFTITSLHGEVADQSALHGILNQIRDLGTPLLLVKCLSTPEE